MERERGRGRLGVTRSLTADQQAAPMSPVKPGRSPDCGGGHRQSVITAGLLCFRAGEAHLQHLHTADTFSVVPPCAQLCLSDAKMQLQTSTSSNIFLSAKIQNITKKKKKVTIQMMLTFIMLGLEQLDFPPCCRCVACSAAT